MVGYGGRRGHLRPGEGKDVERGGDGGPGAAELRRGAEGLSGGSECGGAGGRSGGGQGGFGRADAVVRERGRLGLRGGEERREGWGRGWGGFWGVDRYGVLRCSDTAAWQVRAEKRGRPQADCHPLNFGGIRNNMEDQST